MALHHSDSLVESLKHVARLVWTHSSLFSHAGQDGEFAVLVGFVLDADRHVIRSLKDVGPPADRQGMPARLL